MSLQAAIRSDFNDGVYPGEAGNGWEGGWTHSTGANPEIVSETPIDANSPYLRVNFSGATGRNVARRYDGSGDVDINQPHKIEWKFRLVEDDYAGNFTTFNDRVHFFARNAPRLTASTDANNTWSIIAAGTAHSSGAAEGQTFWVYDNTTGGSEFNLENNLDTGVLLEPSHVYWFSVTVDPASQTYTVSITDETAGILFKSEAPHRFRDLSATGLSHTLLHFGVLASAASELRGFDFDSLVISAAEAAAVAPRITNVQPADQAQHRAENGLRFEVLSSEPVATENIRLLLNDENVSAGLAITGEPTHRSVVYNGLLPNRVYQATITASNSAGESTVSIQFNTAEGPTTVFDSGGFEDDTLYPLGPLGPVAVGESSWAPAGVPSDIVDSGDAQKKKVLRRVQAGSDNNDILTFPGVSSGVLTIRFDAKASITTARTLDVMLLPPTGSQMASMLGWGINSGKVSYFDGAAWVSAFDLDTGWHTFEMINYLSGPLARTFDLKVDGGYIGRGLPWRHAIAAGTPLSRLRIGAIRGPEGEYADLDNLVVTSEPEALPPPLIVNVQPAHRAHFHPAADGLRFDVTSQDPIPVSGITLTLNGANVSAGLSVSGSTTNRTVIYTNLSPDVVYTAEIRAANSLGENSAVIQFNTITKSTAIVDVNGFNDPVLYPVGTLKPVADDHGTWTPGRTGQPAEIVNLSDASRGKGLRRSQTASENIDILDFTPFNSGALTIEFDARVSTTGGRTLDVALKRTGQNQRASWLAWGEIPGRISYHNGGAWTDFHDLDDQWHRYQIVSYLDGPRAHTFDVFVDGNVAAENLGWSQGFAAGEFFGRIRIGATGGTDGDFADIDNLIVSLSPPPPAITGIVPAGLTLSHPAGDGFRFQVSSFSAIPSDAIRVTLNGADISNALEFTGQPGQWSVAYSGLKPDTFYTAEISIVSSAGTVRQTHSFATFSGQAVVEIEAEDYNYQSGQFQDNPPPSGYLPNGTLVNGSGVGYVDLQGSAGIDYFKATAGGDAQETYRFLDSTVTRYTSDLQRQKHTAAGVPDYEVTDFQTGDWMNYTRTFPSGDYQVFLRAASDSARSIRLDRVVSDRSQANQQTSALGTFAVPNTRGGFAYVPLTDDQGVPKVVSLSGAQTLRLHSVSGASGLSVNFLVLMPVTPSATEIVLVNPAFTGGRFSVSFQTDSGQGYVIEYKNLLSLPDWSVLQTVSGDGTLMTVSDANAPADQRFYRVRAQ